VVFLFIAGGVGLTAFQYLKGTYNKEKGRLFTRSDSDRTRENAFKLREKRFILDAKVKFFLEGGEVLKYVVWRSCGCSIPGGTQGCQVGWGPGQA